MEPNNIVLNCYQKSSWLYTLIWGAALPIFLAYLASASYAFQRRRSDIATACDAIKDMRLLTLAALNRVSGGTPDLERVSEITMGLISRVRLEMLHRPECVQKALLEILEEFLKNAEIAAGRAEDTTDNITKRMTSVEDNLLNHLRQFTVFEAVRQAWSNPGIKVSLDPLLERALRFANQSVNRKSEKGQA